VNVTVTLLGTAKTLTALLAIVTLKAPKLGVTACSVPVAVVCKTVLPAIVAAAKFNN